MTSSGSSNSSGPGPRSLTESNLHALKEHQHCDVTFLVGPSSEKIKCHQLFLKLRSPVFEAMFSERWNAGSKEIEIPDVDPTTFRAFLKVNPTDINCYIFIIIWHDVRDFVYVAVYLR